MFEPSSIRAEMARRRITIEELADKSGLATSTISKILGEDGNPRADSLTKIATALGVHPGIFFKSDLHDGVKDRLSGAA